MKTLTAKLFRRITLVSFLLFIASMMSGLKAQNPTPMEWHTFYGASPTEQGLQDQGKAIFYFDGFLYVAGYVNGPGNFDAASENRAYHSSADGFVAKMTPDGEDIVWVTFLGSQYWDSCLDIKITSGGIYVCGYSGGVWADEAALGPIVKHGHYVDNGNDAFVAKLNFDGTINWLTFLGGDQEDFATSIAVDEMAGLVYLTGYSKRAWSVDSYQLAPINPISADWQEDAFAAKLETDGDYIWHTFMGGSNGNGMWDHGSGIGYDAAGNIYIGGTSTGTWGTPLSGFDHQGGNPDGFLAKLSPDASLNWNLFIGNTENPNFTDECHDIEVDPDGNIFATGFTFGDWASVWDPVRNEYGFNDGEDLFVAKIDTDGDPQWHTIFGAGGGNRSEDILLLDNGDLLIAGVDGAIWGNPAFPKYEFGGTDNFTAKLDNDGNLLWNAIFGGFDPESGEAIAADEHGNVYTTGYCQQPWQCVGVPLNPHIGNPTRNGYHTEIFVAKLNTGVSAIIPETRLFSVIQGETVSTVINVFDLCGELENFLADVGSLVDNGDDTWTWSLVTTSTPIGNHEITISANDGVDYATHTIIELEILPPNQPPVFTIDHNPVYVQKGETATNTGALSDPDGDEIIGSGSWPLQFTNNGDGSWSWSMNTAGMDIGVQTVTLSAFDGQDEGLDYFDVIIKDDTERIGSGLDWLAEQQDDSGGDGDGSWNGQSDCWVQNDGQVTITGFALAKYCGNSYEQGWSPFDPLYDYNEQIVEGFNYLFSRAQSDGEGLGIYFTDPGPFDSNYTTSAVMMAVGASRLRSHLINYPTNPVVDGLSFKDLMKEMVVYIQSTQQPDGSWDGNNDVTGNVAFGLLYAEAFGVLIPQTVKDNLSLWIDHTQRDDNWGGVRSDPSEEPIMLYTAHIMVEMALVGDNFASPRVTHAYDYLADHWCNPEWDQMWADRYVELLYTIMKAFKLYTIETILTCNGETYWFMDLINLVYSAGQNYEEGWWQCTWYTSREFSTCLALLTMEGDIPMPPEDNEPPEITCPADLLVEANNGCAYVGDIGNPEVSDDNDPEVEVLNDAPEVYPLGQTIVTWTATDDDGASSTCVQTVTVINIPPEITSVVAPAEPAPVNVPVLIVVEFNDENFDRIEVDWGEEDPGIPPEKAYSSTIEHTYSKPGVYVVAITVFDACGDYDTYIYEYVVVYDPSEGFVTGGGWIESPAGAYIPEETLTGKANFGFVSKYKKGQSTPDGNTEFQFRAADMNFRSTSYEWLVIAGPKAMFKGEGTINGEGWYGFQLSAIDADLTPTSDVDLFRIRIWDKGNNDAMVYDNKVGEDDPNSDPTTAIAGGSIKIHKEKKAGEVGDDLSNNHYDFKVYPNPFSEIIWFEILPSSDSRAILDIYDLTGRKLARLIDKDVKAGQLFRLDYQPGADVANGILFYKIILDGEVKTGKVIHRRR